MLRFLGSQVMRRFLSTALFGFLMVALGGYLMGGDAMSQRVLSVISSITTKIHFASRAKCLDSAQAGIEQSGSAVADLQRNRDGLALQLRSLQQRRDAIEGRLRDDRRHLRLALAEESTEPSQANLVAILDRVRHGEGILQEVDKALNEGLRARTAADAQLALARESLNQQEIHVESQRVTVAAREAQARSESILAEINAADANR